MEDKEGFPTTVRPCFAAFYAAADVAKLCAFMRFVLSSFHFSIISHLHIYEGLFLTIGAVSRYAVFLMATILRDCIVYLLL